MLLNPLGLTLVYYAKLSNILEKSFLPYIESVTSIRQPPYRNLTAIYDDPKLDYHTNPAAVLLPGHHRDTDTLGTKDPNVLYQRLICCFMRQSMRQRTFCILL